MRNTQLDLADRIAMLLGGGLLVLAIPVMGVLNVLAGAETPLYTYEATQAGETTTGQVLAPALAPEGATIVQSPLFDPTMRAYLAAAGLIVFGLYYAYRLFVHAPREPTEQPATAAAD